ncbi:hypothetical protein CB0940_09988 [Cercospora beticola]|uniref:Uncharacterized protein n=1 Tax=Cercospora beticola TaxID=122368 RepID=A0A2G5HH04_CERBT|nr:hypothetical protein CB0940_09988 [Cercospora beticola]PIA91523.1 hypothetical protein CB0940_09988 [Cercospora beticola]WPB05661.1 hypothetical protein RHO25_010315 [Cercospora beticola]CAK1365503.1 unnamed protein product [Cercospora beticola]
MAAANRISSFFNVLGAVAQNNVFGGLAQNQQVRSFYLSSFTSELIAKWDGDDTASLLNLVEGMEATKSPKPQSSRLKKNKKIWRTQSMLLLAQRDQAFIKGFLDRTLPQQVLQGKILAPKIRKYDQNGPLQPMIYANFIADRHGLGLTCDGYDWFLTAMEVGVGLVPDPANTRTTMMGGQNVYDGANWAYQQARPKGTKTFWAGVDMPTLRKNVQKLVAENRKMVADARAANSDHLIPNPEIGWGYRGYNRLHNHNNLDESSPDIFRYAQLVLRHLFRGRGFRLHQFILFDVWNEVQAGIGESLGSQLGEAYINHGGFNFDQAGVSDAYSWSMTARQWHDVRTAIDTDAYRTSIFTRLQAIHDRIDQAMQPDRHMVEGHELLNRVNQCKIDLAATSGLLEDSINAIKSAIDLHEQQVLIRTDRLALLSSEDEFMQEFANDLHSLADMETLVLSEDTERDEALETERVHD